ncbi:chemotaxis response regulator protein-glutamate methylesterase [Desulfobacterales bacterium HSG2]|nr:chemotaxis response regulator protein-glutamate methylesterase [Desulfobacterales bacterium HSG2]
MSIKTKVLIVDDSRIFRSAIEESLSGENDIKVVGSVRNGVKAIEFIKSAPPDLVTLDVEMPDMDGLQTLAAIQRINASDKNIPPIGVIMISSFTQKGADITIRALEAGAFDFITKPEGKRPRESIEILRRQLVVKVRYFAARRISSSLIRKTPAISLAPSRSHANAGERNEAGEGERNEASVYRQKPDILRARTGFPEQNRKVIPLRKNQKRGTHILSKIHAILIGVSTGGPKALAEMLPHLCEKIRIPIFIVQHMPATFTQSLANSLNARCGYTVTEAGNNNIVQDRHAYIAPGGKHMLLRREDDNVRIVINKRPPEKGCRPSVDILFRSAATVYDGNLIAVILTGMGVDGTKGAGILKRAGAYIIAQDQESSVVWGMPGSAEASGNVDKVIPLGKIPEAVSTIIYKTGGA